MKAKSFLIRLFWLIFAGYTIIHFFTVFVDPYQLEGVNPVNRQLGPNDRFKIPLTLEKKGDDFKFFFVGSSRIASFKSSIIENYTNQKTFNYSLAAASLEDYIAIVNHIVHTQKPEAIYLQLDFFTFNETYSTRHQILGTPLEIYLKPYSDVKRSTHKVDLFFDTTYFSLKSFMDAYKSMKSYLDNRGKTDSPANDPAPPKIASPSGNKTPPKEASVPGKKVIKPKVRLQKAYFHRQYKDFSVNEPQIMKWLGFIKQMAIKNKIQLIVAMSPMNKEHLAKLLLNKNLKKNWLHVKKILANAFNSYHDFNNCSVNSYQGQLYWRDSVHMTPKLADIMISVALSKEVDIHIPKNFGIQITRETIEDYLLNLNELCAK